MPSTRNLRHLNLCFPNFTPESESPPPTSPTATADTPSLHHNHPPCPSSPSIMIKNFNSLFDPTLTCSSSLSTITTTLSFEPEPEPADLASAFASQRFFFSSPGRSNSLIEDTNTNTDDCTQQHSSPSSSASSSSLRATTPEDHKQDGDGDEKKQKKRVLFFKGSMAVATYSPDPYQDFRRSMQEMVEARPELMDVKSNWNVLHELLLCYLALNPKSTHKFILGAFADLLVTLMSF